MSPDQVVEPVPAVTRYMQVKGSQVPVVSVDPDQVRDPVTGFTRAEAEPPF